MVRVIGVRVTEHIRMRREKLVKIHGTEGKPLERAEQRECSNHSTSAMYSNAESSNGRMSVFGAEHVGSNPSSATTRQGLKCKSFL